MEKLLPWYATGQLANADRNDIAKALKDSPELQKQLDLIRQELKETVASNEAMPLPPADATRRFMAMIERDTKPDLVTANRFQELVDWIGRHLAGPPRWAVATALLAIVVQSLLLGALIVERSHDGYQTASGGTETLSGGTLALARFSDGVTLAELSKELAAMDIAIVDGPKGGGLYTLRIGADGMAAAARDQKIATLRARAGIVLFVGPAQ